MQEIAKDELNKMIKQIGNLSDEDWQEFLINYEDMLNMKLSPDYIRGFTKAILMMREQFNIICKDLKSHHKRPTEKMIKEWMGICLKERGILRDFDDSFIRWNGKKEKFEIWRESWNK